MNAWDIERIKEIMKERGLKASDFLEMIIMEQIPSLLFS